MSFSPIFLNLSDKKCLVIGGGQVAERKVFSLLAAGALVTVISPDITERLQKLALARKGNNKINYIPGKYNKGDIEGFILAISATDSKSVNELVRTDADKFKVLLNVVDNMELCDFITPSVVNRGDLMVAISSSGKSPLLTKALGELLDETLPAELAVLTDILGAVRNKLLKKQVKNDKKIEIYNALIDSPLLEWIRASQRTKINELLKNLLGPDSSLSALKIRLKRQ